MSFTAAPIKLAIGGLLCCFYFAHSAAALERHLRPTELAAKAKFPTFGVEVPGGLPQWNAWSELLVLRDHTIGPTRKGFVFCAVPKNGCTLWKQLMLRAAGSDHWNTTNKTLVHNPEASELDIIRTATDIFALMGPDSTTFKAALVRDPVTRVLSSYLDRCVDMKEWHRCRTPEDASFEEVITAYENRGDRYPDIHFMNQTEFCGIQYENFSTWDMIKPFEVFTESSHAILAAANLWERFGANGWGANGMSAFGVSQQPMSNHIQEHSTSDRVCQYYTPELLRRVVKLYSPDVYRFGHRPVRHWTSVCSKAWGSSKEV